jgi:hypothetical protein
MSRRIGLPVKVEANKKGGPVAFTWRGVRRKAAALATGT